MTVTKIYRFTDIDCPNCAAKAEAKIKKIKGVQDVAIAFFAQKVFITADENDFAEIYPAALRAVQSVEADCELIELK
ncbi:MAG: cation transporter [Clostridia bacterium]|nr:cation transporter [Clostridia bacterium]